MKPLSKCVLRGVTSVSGELRAVVEMRASGSSFGISRIRTLLGFFSYQGMSCSQEGFSNCRTERAELDRAAECSDRRPLRSLCEPLCPS
uniref:Uncharacterized protein n=1 Tax=Steinernema glaseri TaxID=37863 RepID=A0A1I8AG60_9BILA